jgi:hypothetical protein
VTGDRDAYAAAMGPEALDRQVADAENRYACCGELKCQGHHSMCRNYEHPETAELIEGQESLL